MCKGLYWSAQCVDIEEYKHNEINLTVLLVRLYASSV